MKDDNRPGMDRPVVDRLMLQRLLALFGAGVLLFNFPLLRLWLSERTVFGLPLLPVALFGAWALLIGLLAVLMERRPGPGAQDKD